MLSVVLVTMIHLDDSLYILTVHRCGDI